jgi:hypothetical protein
MKFLGNDYVVVFLVGVLLGVMGLSGLLILVVGVGIGAVLSDSGHTEGIIERMRDYAKAKRETPNK